MPSRCLSECLTTRHEGQRRCSMCRSFRPPRTSYPWLSLRATRSKGYASGLLVGACQLIGRACIREQHMQEVE